jgi:hypothetical protein
VLRGYSRRSRGITVRYVILPGLEQLGRTAVRTHARRFVQSALSRDGLTEEGDEPELDVGRAGRGQGLSESLLFELHAVLQGILRGEEAGFADVPSDSSKDVSRAYGTPLPGSSSTTRIPRWPSWPLRVGWAADEKVHRTGAGEAAQARP